MIVQPFVKGRSDSKKIFWFGMVGDGCKRTVDSPLSMADASGGMIDEFIFDNLTESRIRWIISLLVVFILDDDNGFEFSEIELLDLTIFYIETFLFC